MNSYLLQTDLNSGFLQEKFVLQATLSEQTR
jgi:hypothetical protein